MEYISITYKSIFISFYLYIFKTMSSHQYFQFQTNTKFFQPLLSHNCNVFQIMRNLNSIIPNTFALQSVPKCLSNLLWLFRLSSWPWPAAAPTMLAEPWSQSSQHSNHNGKILSPSHPGHTDKFFSIATTIQQSSLHPQLY